jgi:hypothetical protein
MHQLMVTMHMPSCKMLLMKMKAMKLVNLVLPFLFFVRQLSFE